MLNSTRLHQWLQPWLQDSSSSKLQNLKHVSGSTPDQSTAKVHQRGPPVGVEACGTTGPDGSAQDRTECILLQWGSPAESKTAELSLADVAVVLAWGRAYLCNITYFWLECAKRYHAIPLMPSNWSDLMLLLGACGVGAVLGSRQHECLIVLHH